MKKILFLLLCTLPLLAFKCGGGSDKKEGSGDAIFQEGEGSTAPPAKQAPAPTTYSDGAGGNPPPKTVITDDGSPDSSTTTATESADEMTDSGFTRREEKRIEWIQTILSKKVLGYGKITQNLMDRRQCTLFTNKKFKEPLDALNYWGRHRHDRSMVESVQEQLKIYSNWKIEHGNADQTLRKLKLVEEAWSRVPAYETKMPN